MTANLKMFLRIMGLFGGLLVLIACTQVYLNSGNTSLPAKDAYALRVATYNVHYILPRRPTGPWSMADWDRRKVPLDQALKYIDADLVAFQEMESFYGRDERQDNLALEFLLENNPEYAAAASGDPEVFPDTQPIFYRTDRLDLTDQGWFFFSDTPDVIYSRTFDGSYPAYATWAAFIDKTTGAQFRVVNFHTDYSSRSNRLQSVELVAGRITPWITANETVLVMGDLNGRLGSRTLEIIEEVGVTFAPVEGATYHFNHGLNLFGAIDHVGWTGNVKMMSEPIVIRQKFQNEWPSDHYPYFIDLVLP